MVDGTEHTYSVCVIPNKTATIGTGEQIDFSCTIITRETITCEIVLLTNCSPDGNIRYRWIPFDQVDISFEAINRPFFIGTSLDIMDVNTGVKQLEATVKNIGTPASTGTVPISWDDLWYELQLETGSGTLVESVLGLDLNGNGNILDSFSVTWYPNGDRQYDALINNGTHDIHAYSFMEGGLYSSLNRSYYIDGNPKLFQLGSEWHSLYIADNNYAIFGLGAVIQNHPSPNVELVIENEGAFPAIHASDFKINGAPTELNLTWLGPLQLASSAELWSDMAYIDPNTDFVIDQDEEMTFSCTFAAHEAKTSDVYFILNWSPDGNIRYLYVPFLEEVTFNLPEVSVVDSAILPRALGVYQLTATIQNTGAPAITGTMALD